MATTGGKTAAQLLESLRRAGAAGLSAAALKLEPAARAAKPRREALEGLLAGGEALAFGAGRAQRFLLAEFALSPESAAGHLLEAFRGELADGQPPVMLYSRHNFAKRLFPFEHPQLQAALDLLQARREILLFLHGGTVLYAFAAPVKVWLSAEAVPATPAVGFPVDGEAGLFAAYHRLVRESGGFPDVKISQLRRALGPASGATISERLVGLWREGLATLSLGDWSLASEEMREAAVELDGERYLLVRLEDANDSPEGTAPEGP